MTDWYRVIKVFACMALIEPRPGMAVFWMRHWKSSFFACLDQSQSLCMHGVKVQAWQSKALFWMRHWKSNFFACLTEPSPGMAGPSTFLNEPWQTAWSLPIPGFKGFGLSNPMFWHRALNKPLPGKHSRVQSHLKGKSRPPSQKMNTLYKFTAGEQIDRVYRHD